MNISVVTVDPWMNQTASRNPSNMATVLPFVHPATIVIAGPTKSGKTQLACRLLELRNVMFDPPPQRIVYVYGEKQEANRRIMDVAPGVTMTNKFDEALYKSFDRNTPSVLVLDDQMQELGSDPILKNLFTKGSHHRNITIIYIVQNLYDQGRSMVTVGRNAHYKILMKNPNDRRQIMTLGSSMMPGNSHQIVNAFHDATKEPYGYLLVDCTQETPDAMRLRTKIFPDEETTVYTPDDYINDSDSDDEPLPT